MKKEIAALLTLVCALTSCEMEEKKEPKHELKVVNPNPDAPVQVEIKTGDKDQDTPKVIINGQK